MATDATDKQRQLVRFVADFTCENRFSPTLEEIGVMMRTTKQAARDMVAACVEKNLITTVAMVARSITLTAAGYRLIGFNPLLPQPLHDPIPVYAGLKNRTQLGVVNRIGPATFAVRTNNEQPDFHICIGDIVYLGPPSTKPVAGQIVVLFSEEAGYWMEQDSGAPPEGAEIRYHVTAIARCNIAT